MTYPLHLGLTARRVRVTGGRPVATRRAAAALAADAEVDVAPALCEDLTDLSDAATPRPRTVGAGLSSIAGRAAAADVVAEAVVVVGRVCSRDLHGGLGWDARRDAG